MIQPVTKTIDDMEFVVQPWPARQAFQNQLILGRLLAPALKDLGKAVMTNKKPQSLLGPENPEVLENEDQEVKESQEVIEQSIDLGLVGSAFSSVLSSIDPRKSDELIAMMLSSTFYKSKKLTPEITDTIFMGRFETLYKLFGLVLEVNFGSFLAKTGIGRLLKNG